MANVLVGYATRGGATREVAEAIAAGIRQAGHTVEVADLKSTPTIDGIDAAVIGSGIQAGVWYSESLQWLDQNAAALGDRPVALFNVCLTAQDPAQRDSALAYNKVPTAKLTAVADAETFAGRYVPAKASWWQRLLLKGLRQGAQDHVDPAGATAWGKKLAALV